MSDHPAQLRRDDPPSIAQQRQIVLSAEAANTAELGERWREVADLLDELVADYDEHLESEPDAPARAGAGAQLQRVMDAFDLVGAAARHNAEVLEDLASEITIAQARMTSIWSEYESERAPMHSRIATGLLDRRYSTRAAREVWYPLDGAASSAAARLHAFDAAEAHEPVSESIIPLTRR